MITVAGPALTATIDPERGGKITSVRSAAVEWLAQSVAGASRARGRAFVEAEMSGWDECAPSIVACTVDGHDIPDHGDLWDVPFRVDPEPGSVTAVGSSLGYRFRRRISATPSGLRLDYAVEALEGRIPFLWAAHPQFAAPPGTRVELDVDRVVDVLEPDLPERAWDERTATIDTVPAGGSRKVYAHPSTPARGARLVRGSGDVLSMRWSEECPYVGVWFDAAAFSREPVIAVEPSTGYFDSLRTAVDLGRVAVVEPGRPLTWWVELEARGPAPAPASPAQWACRATSRAYRPSRRINSS